MSGGRSIAIVGIAGRFPGAPDVASLWEGVLAGREVTAPVREGRWPVPAGDVVVPSGSLVDSARSPHACSLESVDLDVSDLALPAELLPRLGRLARLTLRVGADAWANARMTGPRERVGVILANIALPTDEASAFAEELFLGPVDAAMGSSPRAPGADPLDAFPSAIPAGLLARALGLGGGSFTLDAACASSLYAIHLACADLEAGRADAVIAGGVSLPQSLYTQVGFTQLQALSPSGRCAPYDEAADGLVVGEGAGMVVLRRLEDAERDGQEVLAVIRGVGLSNDVGGSLLSPESEGQLRAMRAAYVEAGWAPDDVDLIEGHGTGTARGDAVEVASLRKLWEGRPARGTVLGSVKGNVGHLLTAAGIAAVCKVVAALRAKVLPPSVGTGRPAPGLKDGPLRLLARPAPWGERDGGAPRRAAVSGFGFGGINAHLLLEEAPHPARPRDAPRVEIPSTPCEVAVVGMAAHVGGLDSLAAFRDAVLGGTDVADERPAGRWEGLESSPRVAAVNGLRGAWLRGVALEARRFKIPPNDLASILPQQLLMLKVAGEALDDAGWGGEGARLRTGAVVGLGLDLATTSFHLRWLARERVRRWNREQGLGLDAAALEAWAEELRASLADPLDATRTLGALGGIVPSRVAREFHLGGPSFAVADDEASGLRAVEVAVRMLQRREVDTVLAGAVDLAGDVRTVVARAALAPISPSSRARPFDARADGGKVAEGAAAVVLKRLDDAVAAGDRIYAVLRGFGASGGGALAADASREDAYVRSVGRALREAAVAPARVGLVEAHGSGVPSEDATEARGLARAFGETSERATTALSSVPATIGQAGSASSLLSLVKAALCLHGRVIPPVGHVARATRAIDWAATPFFLPRVAESWLRDRAQGPRVAAVGSMGADGTCLHAVLAEHEPRETAGQSTVAGAWPVRRYALFVLRGALARAQLRALAATATDLESLAVAWHAASRVDAASAPHVTRALVAGSIPDLVAQLDRPSAPPTLVSGDLAVVFPGSGNHFLGMGRELALAVPEVYRALDAETPHLAGHLQPRWLGPRRFEWPAGWDERAEADLVGRPERVIVAQVAHGIAVHDALCLLGVMPQAYVGYSLGESAALFASRAWKEREVMFRRTLDSPLFRTALAGPMTVLRDAWGEGASWRVCIVTRPGADVRAALTGTAALLIVNAPGECVIGGTPGDVAATVARLGCDAIDLTSVPTVHLPLVESVRGAYHDHHVLATTPPPGVRFYSGAWARAFEPTESTAAASITDNALAGFDFPAVVERAYADGVRVFVEAGPQGSCTRMIGRILEGRPHLAVSACQRGVDGYRSLLTALGRLAEAGVAIDLGPLYGKAPAAAPVPAPLLLPEVPVGRLRPTFRPRRAPVAPAAAAPASRPTPARPPAALPAPGALASFFAAADATARAHATFLEVAAEAAALQASLFGEQAAAVASGGVFEERAAPAAFLERAACIEFAVGKLGNVLGPAFAAVDAFPTRVRLPDEPLMLVDRVVSVEGEPGSLGQGRVVTEHDVLDNAWYLDGDRAPVCVSVEAGQADLLLSAYLGIDRETRGERVYRLLDAKIVFHRDLPRPGERIRYDIRIDRFIRQGDTWLFFFRFDGSIAGRPFITMYDGCAGFFSLEQLQTGRGIVPRGAGDKLPAHPAPATTEPFAVLVPVTAGALDDAHVDALRCGDLAAAFGDRFAGKTLAPSLRLPGGRMRLVHRIVSLDPAGGPSGKGEIVGEADVSPDAWYLVCHFIDDQVMPGTLMYECCLHTLRVLLLRLGWVTTDDARDVHYGPIAGVPSELRCRGQVTRDTKKVRYRVRIESIGYDPEPYVLATASMFADDKHVVQMEGMSVRLRGLTRRDVEAEWAGAAPSALASNAAPAFDRTKVVAYAEGNPSECFGDRYLPFDDERRLARLPRDPYLFVDRVERVEQAPWVLEPGGWVTCSFDVKPDAWYFAASGQRTMPFAVLLEAALQPCGWLAAYLGSALLSDTDLHFRNLDGEGTQLVEIGPDAGTLTTRARLTKTSLAGGMILQEFDLEVLRGRTTVYAGKTGFGFFPTAALAAQVGLRGAATWGPGDPSTGFDVAHEGPADPEASAGLASPGGLALPLAPLSMIDRVESFELHGGPAGLGAVVGTKRVDPSEWFFRAHFYQDPVMPGSLGLEALLELAKLFARRRFPALATSHRFETMARGRVHRWQYRGQVVPTNGRVRVEMRVTAVEEGPSPLLVVDGQLSVDGKVIYAMKDFAVRLVPEAAP